MGEENKIRDAADAIKGVAEAVPIYQDAIQPTAKEIGIALQTVAKTIHIALAPVSALVWGYDQIKDFVTTRLAEKLANIPSENITSPKPNIAGPALESLRYTGHEQELRELYANLLATAMDVSTLNEAHPSFVEMIKQLTPDEAKILEYLSRATAFPLITLQKENTQPDGGSVDICSNFSLIGIEAGCSLPELTPSYLDNLARLGLIHIPEDSYYALLSVYEPLETHPDILALKKQIHDPYHARITRKLLDITSLGRQFLKACVINHGDVSV